MAVQTETGGCLFIISAPSGAGKSTLCHILRDRFSDLRYSISTTTRTPRGSEREGVDYFFTSVADFKRGIAENRFAEWAQVHGHYYGTSAAFIERHIGRGQHLLLDIDVQGAMQILERYPESVTIFIMPPSLEVLRERLQHRGTDDSAVIARRLAAAENEMRQQDRYGHVIVNDDLETASKELITLVAQYRATSCQA